MEEVALPTQDCPTGNIVFTHVYTDDVLSVLIDRMTDMVNSLTSVKDDMLNAKESVDAATDKASRFEAIDQTLTVIGTMDMFGDFVKEHIRTFVDAAMFAVFNGRKEEAHEFTELMGKRIEERKLAQAMETGSHVSCITTEKETKEETMAD